MSILEIILQWLPWEDFFEKIITTPILLTARLLKQDVLHSLACLQE